LSTVLAPSTHKVARSRSGRSLRTVGLFAGIGGLELGLSRAGHQATALCEIDASALAVLSERFPKVQVVTDVADYVELPANTQLITAGFPCQDLSQAGLTRGIDGARSGLVGEVFRLLDTHDVPWVLLENVPFMLHLARGRALAVILDALEELDYRWAYRVVNTRAFGLPQRRERVFFVASRTEDPRDVLLADDVGDQEEPVWTKDVAAGFYWTEGRGGLGWAVDAVPTLKNGSTIGIASPPGIVLPNGEIVKPGIRDAERLQGLPADWTAPAERVGRASLRWRLVGNAVTVDVAQWIGERLLSPGKYEGPLDEPLRSGRPWPRAAYNVGEGRIVAAVSAWPMLRRSSHLHEFLTHDELTPLSLRAVSGFLSRYEAGGLKKSKRFLDTLHAHKARMEREADS
jgi:DNA (cytosine-5)-methyltransferase 1